MTYINLILFVVVSYVYMCLLSGCQIRTCTYHNPVTREEVEGLVGWVEDRRNWGKQIAFVADEVHIMVKKLSAKVGNMKRILKAAKGMQKRSGWGESSLRRKNGSGSDVWGMLAIGSCAMHDNATKLGSSNCL